MFEHMQSAEETSQLIAEIYYRASQYLSREAREVFEKYISRYNLTEEEARQLLNTLQDPASIQELLEKLQGGVIPAEKAEILRVLESQAYRARIERFEQLQAQIDLVMQNQVMCAVLRVFQQFWVICLHPLPPDLSVSALRCFCRFQK